jgi:hypothetical protein
MGEVGIVTDDVKELVTVLISCLTMMEDDDMS